MPTLLLPGVLRCWDAPGQLIAKGRGQAGEQVTPSPSSAMGASGKGCPVKGGFLLCQLQGSGCTSPLLPQLLSHHPISAQLFRHSKSIALLHIPSQSSLCSDTSFPISIHPAPAVSAHIPVPPWDQPVIPSTAVSCLEKHMRGFIMTL